ncbi:hypothetical protein GGR21_003121 [Dysgonomonas hofstadii]|uniref:Uncharacterized protein n=1 Tax=Dysgonomonas hofstadii TaxID=637886 RepID=A0A840CP92_9BACT|nr:hypothetical protein [Dysgonomonas hofstadii]
MRYYSTRQSGVNEVFKNILLLFLRLCEGFQANKKLKYTSTLSTFNNRYTQ